MKILFVGDYSGFHATLAAELRHRGHEASVISSGSGVMNTDRDISLKRQSGLTGGMKYLYRLFSILPQMSGYDIVQLVNPHFLHLRPGKISYFFNRLRATNSRLSLTLCGTDYYYVEALTAGKLLQYSEFKCGDRPTGYQLHHSREIERWLRPPVRELARIIYQGIDGAASALYEYHLAATPHLPQAPDYVGIPVNIDTSGYASELPMKRDGKVNVLLAFKSEYMHLKGIDRLRPALQNIAAKHPDRIRLTEVSDVPLSDYLRMLSQSDVIVDQLYSYTPATAALQAMAAGRVVVSGGEQEYYNFINESQLHPIINLNPISDDIEVLLEHQLLDSDDLLRRAAEGPEFVRRHNSATKVADRFLQHWQKLLSVPANKNF